MNNKCDRRDFDRFPADFEIEVAAQDSEGRKYKEKTVLRNISGGGAKFITQQDGKYFPGQLLEMTIMLTGLVMMPRLSGLAMALVTFGGSHVLHTKDSHSR